MVKTEIKQVLGRLAEHCRHNICKTCCFKDIICKEDIPSSAPKYWKPEEYAQCCAVYAGSFDPFTMGHYHIYKKAAQLFAEIHIVIAENPSKKRFTGLKTMTHQIQKVTGAHVVHHEGFVADYCQAHNIKHLVRGLRNTSDWLYEEEISKVNLLLNSELDTLYFRADKYEVISSSLVKLMYQQGRDVSEFLPPGITL
jgi:pantetheine-phosphate adenylyltransferase